MEKRNLIKNSIECQWRKGQITLWLVIVCFVYVVMFVSCLFQGMSGGSNKYISSEERMGIAMSAFGYAAIIFAVILLPFLFYYLCQYRKLFKNCEKFELYEVRLDKPSTSYLYRGAVLYTVSFVTKDGKSVMLDTKPLWSSSAFSSFQLEEYNNKKIDVLYDRENERIIVVGLTDNKREKQ